MKLLGNLIPVLSLFLKCLVVGTQSEGISDMAPCPVWYSNCVCPKDLIDPVCGEDDITYSNCCAAQCAGVEVKESGICLTIAVIDKPCPIKYAEKCNCPSIQEEVCGTDGKTYSSCCQAQCFDVEVTRIGKCDIDRRSLADKTKAFALLFASIQGIPDRSESTDPYQYLYAILDTFDPMANLDLYKNPEDVKVLLDYVEQLQESTRRRDNSIQMPSMDIQLSFILIVLYQNYENWELFFNTSVWLLNKADSVALYQAITIVVADKYTDIPAPSVIEVLPQMFLHKKHTLKAAGILDANRGANDTTFPLQYWQGDPGINEFHFNWHLENAYWWDENVFGVVRDRAGEIFMYIHHQMMNRYNAERLSNGLEEAEPLELHADYIIPEQFSPDVLQINFEDLMYRRENERLGHYDSGGSLETLKTWFDRLNQAISQGYMEGPEAYGSKRISLKGEDATNILGYTVESSYVHSANRRFYGSFHNDLHAVLAGYWKPVRGAPGVEGNHGTSIKDPVFFRMHKMTDTLYLNLKSKFPPYPKTALDFPGVSIKSVSISNNEMRVRTVIKAKENLAMPTFFTYFGEDFYDISTAARPRRSIEDNPMIISVKTLQHVPFTFNIVLESTRTDISYGMVRIFMWPVASLEGQKLDDDEAHIRAFELDRFLVQIEPGTETIITRSSLESSLTQSEYYPGIKALYTVTETSNLQPGRACGFPNNLLIPKGTEEGLQFKLVVYLSDETDGGWVEEFPNYPLCGALKGLPYPDRRPMGFPFDRLGTSFDVNQGECPQKESKLMGNVKLMDVMVVHISNVETDAVEGEKCDCDYTLDPVCGMDGVLYKNLCLLKCVGTQVLMFGKCGNLDSTPKR